MYALGHFGKLLARSSGCSIASSGSEPQPLAPALPRLRATYAQADDDERLLRYMFAGNEVDTMLAAGPLKVSAPASSPVAELIEALARRPEIRYLEVQKKDARVAFARGSREDHGAIRA